MRHHNIPGGRLADAGQARLDVKLQQMDQLPYSLDKERRAIVLTAIREGCRYRGWMLWAAHVRTNHLHMVAEAEVRPETIMNALKSYASRDLNSSQIDKPGRKRWTRHGSTRWLWKDADVQGAIRYLIDGQGEAMEVYCQDRV